MQDRGNWAIGGGVIAGVGVGLLLLKQSALLFVGSIIAGLGVGLLVGAIVSRRG